MSLLERVHNGASKRPPRLAIFGTNGIGKSTLAANAPKPIFIPTEDGLSEINCASLPVARTYAELRDAIAALYSDPHDYQTAVLDTADWAELLICDAMCKQFSVSGVEQIGGGFGKWMNESLTWWREILTGLDALRNQRNMAVIVLAHSKTEEFKDPHGPSYDRYAMKVNKQSGALITEWADAVLFATFKYRIAKEGKGIKERNVATPIKSSSGDIERVLVTGVGPTCIAKNHYAMPHEMPLSWEAVQAAITGGK